MKKVKLTSISPSAHNYCKSKEDAVDLTNKLQKKLYDLLYLMFAHDRYSLLIILHGIDTAGKDGTVRHIFSGGNPQGIKVFSFKKPSTEEFRHDFLWRCHLHVPECGLTTIFNRSYYEEVTTSMVHPEFLIEQRIPDELRNKNDFFEQRYERINEFEKMLTQKGTLIVKFFLHISKKEQKIRIDERLKNLSKNWKFSIGDVKNRKFWNKYRDSFEKMLSATSTKNSPWTIVPADNKWYRDYIVSKTLVERLEHLNMSFPKAKR
jgi:PPK2 family polyphosphate:nucleotide phosphotransferase